MANTTMKTGMRAAVFAVALFTSGCTSLDNFMVSIFGRSMRNQPSLGTYEGPLAPPAGSVAFSAGNFAAAPGGVNLGTTDGVEAPAPISRNDMALARQNPQNYPLIAGLTNPVEASPASLQRGEQVFNRACAPCHGTTGAGDGTVTRAFAGFGISLVTPEVSALSDSYIYSMIRVGRGIMPPYGHQVSHFDRWHVVNYLRQLQGL